MKSRELQYLDELDELAIKMSARFQGITIEAARKQRQQWIDEYERERHAKTSKPKDREP